MRAQYAGFMPRAKLCIPRCLNRHVSRWGVTSDIVRMRRPFGVCSQEASHDSGTVAEALRPVIIEFSVAGMHRTQQHCPHESFRSVMWCSDSIERGRTKRASRGSWICPCILDAAKGLVVSIKRGAENAALCGACQTSRLGW
jgi:hypothetical protein